MIAAWLVSEPNPVPLAPDLVGDEQIDALALELRLARRLDVAGLGREPHQAPVRGARSPELAEDVGRRLERELGGAVVLLQLAVGGLASGGSRPPRPP